MCGKCKIKFIGPIARDHPRRWATRSRPSARPQAPACPWCPARTAPSPTKRRPWRSRAQGRLSGHHQGHAPAAAGAACAWPTPTSAWSTASTPPARRPRRPSATRGLPREVRRGAPPHRDPDPGRRPRQHHPPGRARLLDPAPPPEAGRGEPSPGHHRETARSRWATAAVGLRQGRRLRERRHGRVPRRQAQATSTSWR